jgi:hypothetical protein
VTELDQLLADAAGPSTELDLGAVRRRVDQRRRRRQLTRGSLGALALLLVGLVTGLVVRDQRGSGLQVGGPSSTLPALTAPRSGPSTLITLTASGIAIVEPLTGQLELLDVGVSGSWCGSCTASIARVGRGIVFVLDGHAYWLADPHARAVDLGAGDRAYEAVEPGSVWVDGEPSLRRIDVASDSVVQTAELPSATALVRAHQSNGVALREGLVVQQADGSIGVLNPSTGATGWTSGEPARWMGAATTANGSFVAWVPKACAGDSESMNVPCPLRVSEVSRGTTTTVALAEHTSGYVVGVQFSPDGRWLAAATWGSTGSGDGPLLELAMIDLASSTPTSISGSEVVSGPLGAAINWSVDGQQVYWSGDGGVLNRLRVGEVGADNLPGRVLPAFVAIPAESPPPPDTVPFNTAPAGSEPGAPTIPNAPSSIALTTIDGTVVRINAPVPLDAHELGELNGSIYVNDNDVKPIGWKFNLEPGPVATDRSDQIPVPAGSHASRALIDASRDEIHLQFGDWDVQIAGRPFTDAEVDRILRGFDVVVQPDGTLRYAGSLRLGPSGVLPDESVEGATTDVAVHRGDCGDNLRPPGTPTRTTPSGLLAWRVTVPGARGPSVAFCTPDHQTEVSILTLTALTDQQIDAVTLDVQPGR